MARVPLAFDPTGPLPAPLGALCAQPARAALFVDFDGTLAPIVTDPAAARPLPEAPAALAGLAQIFGLVAVVSGRTGAFLAQALPPMGRVRVVGAYGAEELGPDRTVVTDPAVAAWLPTVAAATERAHREAPEGVIVEDKGSSLTLHWRRAPARAGWAAAFAAAEAVRSGLVARHARMSIELLPPLPIDKGAVVGKLAHGFQACAYVGDDLGDLPAFAALDHLAQQGAATARVCVLDAETPPDLLAQADVTVNGPAEVLALFERLLAVS